MPATSGGPRAQAVEPRVIEVVARRYAFEPDVIEVIVGERVRLMVRSADGLHGLEIKKFKVSKDGRFPILCSEYCGDEHDSMRGTLVVLAQ